MDLFCIYLPFLIQAGFQITLPSAVGHAEALQLLYLRELEPDFCLSQIRNYCTQKFSAVHRTMAFNVMAFTFPSEELGLKMVCFSEFKFQ